MYIDTLPLVVWTLLATTTHVATEGQYGIGLGIKREVFFLNLEDGYFGCQVNESTQILQLYELSKLCDGVPDCYKASDELRSELKCTDDCTKEDGAQCINGACLNGVCHCNDGFGGCNCQEADVNECKERPCDVFAHCTNTVGSFQCSCFPGYEGDGFTCRDINECEDPAVASRCVANAECCNLPAHFICKCNRGFEGDGEEECRDIDECRRPGACGINAICQNYPGNYTCACLAGYTGSPFDGCVDVDECASGSACGAGATCRNVEGGFECSCPPGSEGDPRVACQELDACARAQCGRGALCQNLPGAYRCVCPPGFQGNPDVGCTALECTSDEQCAPNLACAGGRCANPCERGGPCASGQHCAVSNHQPVCSRGPVTNCAHCRPGVPCDPFSGACMETSPGTPKAPEPCQSDRDCIQTEACFMGLCQNPCGFNNVCGIGANCHPIKQRPMCSCPAGQDGDPAVKCSPKITGCTRNEDCLITEACINNACQLPCAIHNPCVPNAACINTNHGSDCSCLQGFQGNGYVGCVPVIDSSSVCQYNDDCPPHLLCDRLNRVCINPCSANKCGDNAECVSSNHGIQCQCLEGYTGNAYLECYQVQGCRSDNECANSEACINGRCDSPCRCGINAICDVINHRASCKCLPGYNGNPMLGCDPPVNPCIPNPCGINALCEIDNGNPICYCPKGSTGNPFKNCIPEGNECEPNPCGPNSGCRLIDNKPACFCLPNYEGNPPRQTCRLPSNPCNPSPCGPNTQCTVLSNGFAKCTCLRGFIESPNTVRGCIEARNPCDPNPCGSGARCDPNRAPACYCPESTIGNPYKSCNPQGYLPPDTTLCNPSPCGANADCYVSSNREMCFCKSGYSGDPYVGCQAQRNPCTPNPCGPQAICNVNYDGQASCTCAGGSTGNPYGVEGCLSRECEVDDECSANRACIGYTCRDPCPGACGLNTKCHVESHRPVCVCEDGLIGNPLLCCLPPESHKAISPCNKVQCGINAICQDIGNEAQCYCPTDFIGDPYVECKLECTMNSDCPSNEACVNNKCADPCLTKNVCGLNAACLCSDHTVSCLCPDGYIGDPLVQCTYRPIIIPSDNTTAQPCTPNPCDPNAPCDTYGNQFAICDVCLGPDAVSNPSCRPECVLNSDCAFDKACLKNKCVDPCPGSCGMNTDCTVYRHDPICRCIKDFEGNPYEYCKPTTRPIEATTCDNIQCGANAFCQDSYGVLSCQCLPNFYGNPQLSCRPECVVNSDCATNLACLNNKCENPCKDVCGIRAQCETVNHHAICYCSPGETGDPYVRCQPVIESPPSHHVCDPSPCGPYSRCLVSPTGFPVCSCLPGYRGVAPMCQPECVSNSDCQQIETCVNQKCVNPCLGSCGVNADCIVVNHNPICACGRDKTGDPFVACGEMEPKEIVPKNPCVPSPCGPNSICEIKSNHPVCSCSSNYVGTPPFCRPECVISQECASNQACINEKCADPCVGACGNNAKCDVVNHTPLCSCLEGYRGDAFIGCVIIVNEPPTPCNPSPCGENTICTVVNDVGRCSCIPPNIGNPYAGGCRPECTMNPDCPNNLACLSNHCRDPCKDLCGLNAECSVTNHVPVCTCFKNYEGDPFSSCRPVTVTHPPLNPCEPSPCGPNSECQVVNQRAACSCRVGYLGSPPACRPECSVNSDCPSTRACINQKCKDPCIHSCGLDARCHVVGHNPICTCPENLPEGDPFIKCYWKSKQPPSPHLDPCLPSPCGPHSTCASESGRAVCACEPGTLGAPPSCRPQCVINQDCPLALACLAGSCVNPCVGSCGFNARCIVQNHQPICSCDDGYSGDPFAGCSFIEVAKEIPSHPCNPSPCGPNAICRERSGAGSCTCIDEFYGDPYLGCRPECVMNTDCAKDKACFNNKCVDPCPGTCGQNAECTVTNHAPSCYCLTGYIGNPLHACSPITISPEPVDPCHPSPCGPYSTCRTFNGHAVCTCLEKCIGSPPNCRPECIATSDCRPNKACINQKCQDPCPGMCGINAQCQVVNHNPICSCLSGFTGDPFSRCYIDERPPAPSIDVCIPNPCGPHSQCKEINGVPVCSCLNDYVGRPPNCRPECVIDVECPGNLACLAEKCRDPCPGSCGVHATCTVVKHVPVCSCEQGYTGDPFSGCSFIPNIEPQVQESPCYRSPCGANAICKERNGIGSCSCLPEYYGDPYVECRPECVLNTDCPKDKACFNNKCKDPCPGVCGMNAECRVHKHAPSCACLPGYEGNPFSSCYIGKIDPIDPCVPSPCGPYSVCRVNAGHAICSCQEQYFGSPPSCRPECMVSSECMPNKACKNQRCADPCIGACGNNAKCTVVNHNALCSCPTNYIGDPFVQCAEAPKSQPRPLGNPCVPSPCGPNSQCRVVGETPACSCLQEYIGRAPNCRPECIYDEECPSNLACVREKCVNPCAGSCGTNAACVVINHKAVCHCWEGYTGDPYGGCHFFVIVASEEETNPCSQSPCGPNAVCTERNSAGACTCSPGYFGDPYLGCRPECVTNNDCPWDKACSNNKCTDPCQGACGINAQCTVSHHNPVCLCLESYEGNPVVSCHPRLIPPTTDLNPCMPSPCGAYSHCKVVDGHGVCSCQEGYVGSPPTCRPECVSSTDCPQHQACIQQKCKDPCPGTCGINARCQVINHNPICTCKAGYTGDPFISCQLEPKPMFEGPKGNPCVPSPCGPYSQCKVVGEAPACSCLPNYIGIAPNCRPECSINAECPGNLACQTERCIDPCPGSCGLNADCSVANHVALCNCISGYTGDPFSGCSRVEYPPEPLPNPCNPSPCGANALCKERNGVGSCSCLPEYFGDPYTGCRPECVSNSDCDRNKACSNNRCKDPCPGACGVNAECRTVNHSPTCTCMSGYTGNPLVQCVIKELPPGREDNVKPCQPSPCGPNSLCREVNGHSVCTCGSGYIGTPPTCRPECIVSSECPQDKACVNKKCIDPCPNTCGYNARCQVVTHNPICSCTPGYTGDPFSKCELEEKKVPSNPCEPTPCGPNSECRIIGDQAACSCMPNYIGRVPNCRPECTIDAECPSNTACVNERCRDPCQGACGQNALCLTVNHRPICSCQQGFTGDASRNCIQVVISSTEMTPTSSPCTPSPCGPNAECREHNGAGACVCSSGYDGDPYSPSGCRRECEINDDCAPQLACTRFKCIDPCPGTCGQMAQCLVENHVPICTCPKGFSGDPFYQCKELTYTPPPTQNPCEPSPCGPNSQCRQVNMQAVCSCLPSYVGSPPSCKPECVVNSECDTSKACINQKCDDPCPNTCGLRAHCQVKTHNPICTCPAGMTGDPFTQCYQIVSTTERPPSCTPSPCGPHSRCQLLASGPACSCLPGYVGSPPNCRPECTINSECPAELACVRQKCEDPCPGSCGVDANCHVLNHVAVCVCNDRFTGDPFSRCLPILEEPTTPTPLDPCNPSPCGPNAQCNNGFCTCLPEYSGNPYESCRPECTGSQECPRDKACFRNKCRDPCPGVCGQNAKCDVINHIPSCSCMADFTGNPFTQCRPVEIITDKKDPCHPSPCGPNSICRNVDNTAVCACIEGFQGSPPSCRPECIISSECASTKACVNQKCINPCINSCGHAARCEVINHSPICSCNPGQTGDPFKGCYEIIIPPSDQVDVCHPSPCGPNALCMDRNGKPNCKCIDNYIGQPPNCRPECVINPDCPSNQACVRNKCIDPCPGSCGVNAECNVVSHTVSCSCKDKFTGNPFLQCVPEKEIERQPCDPSPCGANAVCTQRDGAGACSCLEGYFGNPYEGCRPECVLSSDCSADKACIRNKCADPCPGICGSNAECTVINHVPSCACVKGYSGNPFEQCAKNEEGPIRPCQPSPCGPNSICRENGGLASCECLPDYRGAPPDCRPECTVSSECPSDRACHKLKCADPCRGTCGLGAHCQVINHSPLCSCPAGTTGDAFIRCVEPIEDQPPPPTQPCYPNPCGPYSECRVLNGNPSCSCLQGYIGGPPNCRPECLVNTDCPSHQACIAEKCTNPCDGSCGFRAECRVHDHIPICSCPTGFSGDPFIQCSESVNPTPAPDFCNPSPCGTNAICDAGICSCTTGYFGDPYVGCRLECSTNGECSPTRTCQGGKCVDPCPGACGTRAVCSVNNHIPSCSCPAGTSGDPFSFCTETRQPPGPPQSPCSPSPCGPYSECTVSGNGAAACSCRPGHVGSPPSCRPECLVSAECKLQLACIDRRCRDPCDGACGRGARCQVVAHSPICTCHDGLTGDPFTYCYPAPVSVPPEDQDPCQPSPCGPNSICIKSGETPACSCQPGFIGTPPNCRPECTISAECPAALACVNQRCKDPCLQACGLRAVCSVVDHRASCVCEPGLEGDPFQGCTPPREKPKDDPCYPSPCGPGAICRTRGTGASCECEPGLRGDPYTGCRPECLADSDCSPSRACVRSHCRDPCIGSCGIGADCETFNHLPTCSCPPGTRGNPFVRCEEVLKSVPPCDPSPCGPGALCTAVGENAVCSCPQGTSGDAAAGGCRPECVVSSECPRDRACVRNRCVDPCTGACGNGAECRVFDHAPICSCPPPTTGNPFLGCRQLDVQPSMGPCDPNPCGPHGTCRNGFCTYPECVVNDDCSGDRACINQKCTDPCVGACGLNAICSGVRHSAVCSCPNGYTGSPFVRCERIIIPKPAPVPECIRDDQCADNAACVDSRCSPVCGPSNCGLNARCIARQHRARCACLPGYEGDAYTGCYSVQCHSNNDCPYDESCDGGSCVKVCPRIRCGTEAHCVARGHVATCECDSGARGNPWTACHRAECTVDDDCATWLACRGGTCQNPCPGACAPDAVCTVTRHSPVCECPRGTVGNPNVECRRVVDDVECETDAGCGSDLACLQGKCKNPCDATSCGRGAVCRVANTLPFRTLVCECPKPLTGDASVQCSPRGECNEDSECGDEETCSSKRCVPVCGPGACGVGAECRGRAHRASCTCVPPLQGDSRVACLPGLPDVQCTTDSECGSAEACVNRQCVSACAGACGTGALCEALQHRARCHCPPGTAGDPARTCYTPECTSDDNCPFDKTCINGYCQDPCILGSPCGRDATCEAIAHVATCRCPAGTQGDPRRACISAVCHYNEDCDDTQICDRLNRVCRPACSDSACAPGALCTAQRHRPVCSCPPGRSGDPYSLGCASYDVGPECTSDSDCSGPLACVNTRCVDLCVGNPCETGLVCKTVDVLPLRAVACVCPDGGRVAPDSGCRAPPDAECSADSDCANSQTCRRGSCVEACRADPCGLNALCESIDHASRCSCPPEYTGNPRTECNLEPRLPSIWECYNDDECGPERACEDRRCINPCSSACGKGALCRVIDHKAQCSCPRGFSGDARVRCQPPSDVQVVPVGCKANSDCPLSQACINGACAEPCACGSHAECNVVRHHPVCYCEAGYSGNPYIGCTKVGCSSDSECPDSDTCYNGACVNPCIVEAPCSISAECFGRNHRGNCRCPAGTNGNPYTRCQPVECEINADCNDDSVCMKGICRHACSTEGRSACASNAECFARNHAASCKCPPALPIGDPLTNCEKVIIGPECIMDSDCPSGQACLRDQCREACAELQPCQANARCTVSNSVPFRTLICRCAEGYIPDVGGACRPTQLPAPSCSSDDECSDNESCVNRICRNPCNCGENAECFVRNHRPACSCREGFDGNPYQTCRTVGCRSNSECESNQACVNGNCVSPCLLNSNCGPNADCYVERNQPLCRCRPGFEGDAYEGCNAIECRSNGDCPLDKECRGHRCINPCYSKTNCGNNAVCLVRNHIAVCKCEQGFIGSPYVECKPEIIAECFVDADCPPKAACLSSRCVNPCSVLKPCATPAQCEVSPTLPVRTMICTCPPGYISSGGGLCRPFTTFSDVACEIDTNCTSNHACISSVCQNPCECGPNTDCQIKNHKPVCACRPGFIGDARTGCYDVLCRSDSQCSDDETCINNRCIPACSVDGEICGTSAECYGTNHRASCRCKIGTTGNPSIGCTPIGCRANSDCPSDRLCVNSQCIEPCTANTCEQPAKCRVHLHEVHCVCPPSYQSTDQGCTKTTKPQCTTDSECSAGTACLNAKCVEPCTETSPCGNNAECRVVDSLPVRTMVCECLPGYRGNALVECTPNIPPTAVCIEGQAMDANGECVPCRESEGRIVDSRGRCVCDASRGLVLRGDECLPIAGCRSDTDCDDRATCRNSICIPACDAEPCGLHAICTAQGHRSICTCANGYTGNPKEHCNATTPNYRTDFPLPDMQVHCLADAVKVSLKIKDFNGVLYVKGYSKDERCRLVVHIPEHEELIDFTVHFGDCGLVHVNGMASFVLVMQIHPTLLTSNAKAFHIKCIYQTGEKNVTLAFNVSMLTTAGTIANTGPPPTCSMRIVSRTGDEVSSAEIGENLVLQVDVQPSSIYGGFARSCIAKTSEASTNVENEYTVTDADGCATDATIFNDWERSEDGSALRAAFNAFKFPSSDNIRFQCNIRVCFGKCQPVNCRGADAYGKRRKREAIDTDGPLSTREDQIREEVKVESNQILTLERRDPSRVARQRDASGGSGDPAAGAGEVCVSAAGLAVALALTALLALVAVAAAVACWLVAWRRARPPPAPLPHPPDFPNPLFQR